MPWPRNSCGAFSCAGKLCRLRCPCGACRAKWICRLYRADASGSQGRAPMTGRVAAAVIAILAAAGSAAAAGWMPSLDTDQSFTDLKAPADVSPWGDCSSDCIGNWWDNTLLFVASDAWRTRADDDYPGN